MSSNAFPSDLSAVRACVENFSMQTISPDRFGAGASWFTGELAIEELDNRAGSAGFRVGVDVARP